jgi:hypothetical protein
VNDELRKKNMASCLPQKSSCGKSQSDIVIESTVKPSCTFRKLVVIEFDTVLMANPDVRVKYDKELH